MDSRAKAFLRLLDIMDDLREKCPWDRKQTMDSLSPLSIEETYELTDAILEKDMPGIKEEIGDLMLHLVFYAKIADEQKEFTITEVLNDLCDKLIRRHPHIYGDTKVDGEDQVKENWEQIKMKEKKGEKKSVLSGVPISLPALIKAYRMQDKAKQVGFEWDTIEQVWKKIEEEQAELKEAQANLNQAEIEAEFGDLLFAMVNLSRYLNIDPERALELTNKKFKRRFEFIESSAQKSGDQLKDMSLEEMDALWNEAKLGE
ncbi:MAG: nucleoside triphosphate pyrophosphohydrolase [Chitinophagales bacterium]